MSSSKPESDGYMKPLLNIKNCYLKKLLLTLAFVTLISNYSFSQDVYDTMSTQICNCIDSRGAENFDQMMPCIENAMLDNVEALKAENGVESIADIDTDMMGNKVGAILLKTCDRAVTIFGNAGQTSEKIVEKQENISCSDIKNGEFYYLTNQLNGTKADTTYVTISDDLFLERMDNGRTFSLLNVSWKSDCEFELEFVKSNDAFKKELSAPGEVYKYEVMRIEGRSVFVKVFWRNEEFQVELVKLN